MIIFYEEKDLTRKAALKAYKKDIGYSSHSKTKDLQSETTQSKRKYVSSNSFVAKQEPKTKESCCAENVGTSSSGNDDWAAYQTPEGYWYYYNKQTGESRWDPPEGFSFPIQQNQQTLGNSEQSSGELSNEMGKNNEVSNQNKKENNEHVNGPFGKWETVAVYERNDDSETKQEVSERDDKQDKVSAVKFKEKQLPVTKKNDLNDTNIAFKKRKSNQDKKRSIRQRTDDS